MGMCTNQHPHIHLHTSVHTCPHRHIPVSTHISNKSEVRALHSTALVEGIIAQCVVHTWGGYSHLRPTRRPLMACGITGSSPRSIRGRSACSVAPVSTPRCSATAAPGIVMQQTAGGGGNRQLNRSNASSFRRIFHGQRAPNKWQFPRRALRARTKARGKTQVRQ